MLKATYSESYDEYKYLYELHPGVKVQAEGLVCKLDLGNYGDEVSDWEWAQRFLLAGHTDDKG